MGSYMRAHIVENGIVVNTILVESLDFMPGLIDGENGGRIGDLWDGGTFTTPAPAIPVPASITPRQGYIILSRYGLLTPVKAYFAALEGQEGEEAQIELEFAQEWKRSWPTLINAAHSFGLSDAQIDQMFIAASEL